jgi:K+-sensing histidine kinase KdpD
MAFPVETSCGELFGAADSLISNLVHDLRQPLSNIECSVSYLRILLQMSHKAGEHLDLIETQVEEAERMLAGAAACLRSLRAQHVLVPGIDDVSLELTNSATAALT